MAKPAFEENFAGQDNMAVTTEDLTPFVEGVKASLSTGKPRAVRVDSWDQANSTDRLVRRAAQQVNCSVRIRKLDGQGNRVTDPSSETVARVAFQATAEKSRRGRKPKTEDVQEATPGQAKGTK